MCFSQQLGRGSAAVVDQVSKLSVKGTSKNEHGVVNSTVVEILVSLQLAVTRNSYCVLGSKSLNDTVYWLRVVAVRSDVHVVSLAAR